MMEISISKFDNNINIYYTNQKKVLSPEYREAVDRHWESFMKEGKKFFNGDVYTINNIEASENGINIFVCLTNYAHFLYTMDKDNCEENDCRTIYTSVLIETSDNKFAIGEMHEDTSFPLKLQFIGGGIDKEDINGEILDLEHNIKKEIFEELGIVVEDKSIVKSFKPSYLKSGGKRNFLSAIYKMDLLLNEQELTDLLNKHNQNLKTKMELQEIKSLVYVDAEKVAVEEFAAKDKRDKDENLIAALEAEVGIRQVLNFK